MPGAKIGKRGGAIRYRTIKTKNGTVLRVAVVRKKGPQGGKTVAWKAKGN